MSGPGEPTQTIVMNVGEVVFGWDAIAAVLGRSPDTARKLAERNEDPLPVFWEIDRWGAFVQAILAFRSRNRHPLKVHRELIELRAEVRRIRRGGKPKTPKQVRRSAASITERLVNAEK